VIGAVVVADWQIVVVAVAVAEADWEVEVSSWFIVIVIRHHHLIYRSAVI
jgi:hypothetical protein